MRGVTIATGLASLLLATGAEARRHGYQSGESCISRGAIRDETAMYPDELVLHMSGGRVYISHLPRACDGLMSINTLNKVRLPKGVDRICAGDKFELLDKGSVTSAIGLDDAGDSVTQCTLGRFEPTQEMMLPESRQR